MNTYERHRLLLLKRQRARRLRRKAVMLTLSCAVVLSGWTMLSMFSPAGIALPAPARIVSDVVREMLRVSTGAADTIHRRLFPEAARSARRDALALFPAPTARMEQHRGQREALWPAVWSVQDEWPELSRRGSFDLLLIGSDSRLGQPRGRADALQLVSIDLVKGEVEIIGIPRGTPSDLGYDSAQSNIIANTLAAKGRDELLRRIARFTGRDSLRHWIEIGFSDAMGIMELLGFEQPGRELRTLRRREGYRYGDHTRSYKQARFVRTALLRVLPLLGEAGGAVLIAQGLRFVQTNLTARECHGLALLMLDAGIADQPDHVRAGVRSPYMRHLAGDADAAGNTATGEVSFDTGAERRLRTALARSARANPEESVRLLWTMFQQHAWLQVQDRQRRRELRDAMAGQLTQAFTAIGKQDACGTIADMLEAEDALFGETEPRLR